MRTSQNNRAFRPCVGLAALIAALAFSTSAQAAIIVNDSFTDGGRNNGVDLLDANWWTSTASNAIEVSVGSLGLVSGTSGRGIHGTFAPQTLGFGDSLKATYTFRTPATVGTNIGNSFKIGFFNTLGNALLAADLSASTGTPNPLYNPLPGYMIDLDVNTALNNVSFREKSPLPSTTGLLLASTTGYVSLGAGGNNYTFAPSTTYTGVFLIGKTALGLSLTGSLSDGSGLLSTFTTLDATGASDTYDMLGFHSNSNIFGSSSTVGAANNGIDFSNIQIEFIPVPEPASFALLSLAGTLAACSRRRRRA